MSKQIAFDFNPIEADKATEKGINDALQKANHDDAAWGDRAYYHLWKYALNGKEFTTEQAREHICNAGLVPTPDNPQAWGGVLKKLAHEGIIERVGIEFSKNPKAHKRPTTLWKIKS